MEGIAYQNKDILSKIFAESLKEKSFSVYGIDLPKIIEVLPTNLPSIQVNELRLDNLFLLEDNSIVLVDYESKFLNDDILDYLSYVCRILKRLGKGWIGVKIRVLILYTSDVEQANDVLDIGCLTFKIEQAFLCGLDTARIYENIKKKIKCHEILTDDENMQMIILPLTVKGKQEKQVLLKEIIMLAKDIQNENDRTFIMAGLLTFADKIISSQLAEEIRREIRMLKVEKIIFEEGLEEGKHRNQIKIAENMIRAGKTIQEIAEFTEMAIEDILKIPKSISM
ncbi:hypothetical protein [Robinsoniella peoriensis]|uniref:hypothetical protein n=1 Tax=Robinsoniella peoriensis TaxID=180332 RepID=UPI00085C609A|nr:hypothetical protein [Robinsoniella peoriensis]